MKRDAQVLRCKGFFFFLAEVILPESRSATLIGDRFASIYVHKLEGFLQSAIIYLF